MGKVRQEGKEFFKSSFYDYLRKFFPVFFEKTRIDLKFCKDGKFLGDVYGYHYKSGSISGVVADFYYKALDWIETVILRKSVEYRWATYRQHFRCFKRYGLWLGDEVEIRGERKNNRYY